MLPFGKNVLMKIDTEFSCLAGHVNKNDSLVRYIDGVNFVRTKCAQKSYVS
ncbi:hypothetical protein STSP2_02100 [Anaerohalosphaera lusitana]|uniref:Uncharacterized protein n=1 Tax=Anaerohalosphaera lusitana TaxID=1936003 RepID=A0A1U9NLW5_9BACT|nr:hypothetical protein STSP2_02100 [Anaerohalosphaera lusitana]